MNPKNLPMDIEVKSDDGSIEYFFGWNVSSQFPTFCWYYGITGFLVIFLPTMFLKEPNHIKPNLIPWLKAFFQNNKEA